MAISANRKDRYETPLLRMIDLVASEVLGFGCKTGLGGSDQTGATDCVGGTCSNGSQLGS